MRLFVKSKDICLCLCLFFPLFLPVGTWAQSVLVAGGEVSAGPPAQYTSTAEAFDPAAATWTPTTNNIPTSPTPPSVGGLCAPNMALLHNGIVLLAGGVCTDQTQVIDGKTVGYTTNVASLYTPSANQWTAAASMNYGRDQFGMVTLNGGNALAFFGCSGGCLADNILGQSFPEVGPSSEIYFFESNQWTSEAPFSVATGNLSTSNLNQPAVVLQSGQVLACNGSNGNLTGFNTCEIYDPDVNSWSSTGSLPPNEVGVHQMALLGSGTVLTVSTVDGQSYFLFDRNFEFPAWSLASNKLLSPQFGGQLLRLSDGRVLDCGGTLDGVTPVNTAQIYDPTSGTWSATEPMGTARMQHIAVLLADGRVLVAGGQTAGSVILSSAEIFDPTAGTWSPTTPMTQARLSANALLLGSLVAPVAPTITKQPVAAQTINSGQTATLTVAAAGTQPLAYQWYQGTSPDTTNPVSGATASSFTTPALTVSTSYWVLVSNVAGSVDSNTAVITVQTPPTITTQPVNHAINSGQTATLTVVATGAPPPSYQWYLGQSGYTSNPIAGATGSSYTTPVLTMSTSYWVQVSNLAGSVNSNTATITLTQAPTCMLSLQGTVDPLTITAVVYCIDPQGESLTTTITWGDGSSPTTFSGGSQTPSPSHTYAQALATPYTVTVITTDTSGLQGTASSSLTLVTAAPPPITAGQSTNASVPLTLPPGSPMNVLVTFVCTTVAGPQGNVQASDLGITCSSPTVTLSSVAQKVPITIKTTGAGSAALAPPGLRHRSWFYALWLPLPALFLLGVGFGKARLRGRMSKYFLLSTLGVLLVLLASCGGGFSAPQVTKTGTPGGVYQITVVDNPVNPNNSTGFVQTSLIVPLSVSSTQ